MKRVLVVGAGNGGFAAACDLARRGFEVHMFNRSAGPLHPVIAHGGIRYNGVIGEGFAPVRLASTDMAEVIRDAELILVCVPATAHPFIAQQLAPHLREDLPVILNPGGLLGSIAFLHALHEAGFRGSALVGETGTLTYICRKSAPDGVTITSVVKDVPFAAYPGRHTGELTDRVRDVLPMIDPKPHILYPGFANVNAVLHPPGMILGAAWIEKSEGDFYFYYDAATPSVGRLMEAMDRERMAVARAWGVEADPLPDLLARIGSTTSEAAASGDYMRVLKESGPNRYIKAPASLDHRYMHEDIAIGVVPMADLGRACGVPTPVLEAVVTVASTVMGRDYRSEGRTLAQFGLAGKTPQEVLKWLQDGTHLST
jgi:opine dehydrogenase